MTLAAPETDTHGTYSRYQQHRKAGEQACQPCKDALAAYTRDYRARQPDKQMQYAATQMARDRALRRLARMFPQQMHVLYEQELQAAMAASS